MTAYDPAELTSLHAVDGAPGLGLGNNGRYYVMFGPCRDHGVLYDNCPPYPLTAEELELYHAMNGWGGAGRNDWTDAEADQ